MPNVQIRRKVQVRTPEKWDRGRGRGPAFVNLLRRAYGGLESTTAGRRARVEGVPLGWERRLHTYTWRREFDLAQSFLKNFMVERKMGSAGPILRVFALVAGEDF